MNKPKNKLLHFYADEDFKNELTRMSNVLGIPVAEVIRGCIIAGANAFVAEEKSKKPKDKIVLNDL